MENNIEIKMAKIEQQMNDTVKSVERIEGKLDQSVERLEGKLDQVLTNFKEEIKCKADKDDFIFWRNILVGGILVSIFLGVFTLILDKFIK